MSIKNFYAETDIVGRRIKISWDFDIVELGKLSEIPPVVIRRKTKDFEYPPVLAPDQYQVYDSSNFPPADTSAVELPGWEEREGDEHTIYIVESASQTFGDKTAEVIRRTEAITFDLLGRPLRKNVTILDYGYLLGGLKPATSYYYEIFSPVIPTEMNSYDYRSVSKPGEAYGMGKKLYKMLPAMFHRHDVVTRNIIPGSDSVPEMATRSGQLRRFMDPFGASLDMMRSSAEGLQTLRNIETVDFQYLPLLSNWIGWELDYTTSIPIQRSELQHASILYKLVGSIPGCVVWSERLTGWKCEVKEFIHNVFRTNSPESIPIWEIWQKTYNGIDWSDAIKLTHTDGFDGRPVVVNDASDVLWMFWEGNRSNRTEIWLQRLDGVDAEPLRLMSGTSDDATEHSFEDRHPFAILDGTRIWLFWTSDREGVNDIWVRPIDSLPAGAPEKLTIEGSDDSYPVAIKDLSGNIWLFWQSDRRGRMDIWARMHDGISWNDPQRITTSEYRDEKPAVALDDTGKIWLFWNSLANNSSNIMYQIFDVDHWSETRQVTNENKYDSSPTAIFWNAKMWVLWQSKRSNGFQIRASIHDGVEWQNSFEVSKQSINEKEPSAVIDSTGNLRISWRSQEGSRRYQSVTVDTDDSDMLSRLKTINDRSHYTIDTGTTNDDWYEPNTIGLYLTPDTADETIIASKIERASRFMEPFRPLTTRIVWQIEPAVFEEVIDTDSGLSDELLVEVVT